MDLGQAGDAIASSARRAGRMRTSRGNASGLSGADEKNRSTRNVVGPTTSRVLTICSRRPCTMDAIVITVATPITTPRMVSPERSLFVRSWSRAMSQPSVTEWSLTGGRRPASFGPQRRDRIQPGARPGTAERDARRAQAPRQRHYNAVTRAGSVTTF
jgi:hypothetical protein